MRINDLEEFGFTHAEVVKLLPKLSPKTLRNWSEQGLLDLGAPQGRGHFRKYSAAGVIMLSTMTELVLLGVRPSDARDMADGVAARAVALWATAPDEAGDDGERKIVFRPGTVPYYRGIILRGTEGRYRMDIVEKEGSMFAFQQTVYLTIQIDRMIINMLNRMHRHVAGLAIGEAPPPASKKRKPKTAKKGRRK